MPLLTYKSTHWHHRVCIQSSLLRGLIGPIAFLIFAMSFLFYQQNNKNQKPGRRLILKLFRAEPLYTLSSSFVIFNC